MYNEQFFGGTETMARGFIEKILPEMKNIQKYHCIILPGQLPNSATWGTDGKETILWIHNTISQFNPQLKNLLTNKLIKNSVKYIITVSEYAKKEIAKELEFDLNKIVVIPNAINPIAGNPDKFNNVDKVKIIHASSMDRGLDVLINSIPLINEDFELNIFNNFYPDTEHNLNIDGVNDSRVNFWGKTPRRMVYKFFADAHIHAYPSTYPETSCLTQMEALSAGCYTVHTDLGALPETSLGYGIMIPFNELTPKRYAEELTKSIKTIKQNGYDYTNQVEDIYNNFTWDIAKQNWLALDKLI